MATRKNVRSIIIGGACLVIGAAIFLSIGTPGKKVEANQAVSPRIVRAIVVSVSDARESRSFSGMAQAAYETNLAFRVGGPLTGLDIRIGQHVAEGEAIARLDPRDFDLATRKLEAGLLEARANFQAMRSGARAENIEQLEASLDAALARLEEAESNFSRHKSLYEQKAIAKASYDSAKASYNTALAQSTSARKELEIGRKGARKEDVDAMNAHIQLLEANLETARNALADTVLYAPADGNIYKKFVENYEHVAPGQPIVSLLNMSTVEVHTAIPQTLIPLLNSRSGFTCTFDAYPGQSVPARLKEIGKNTEGRGLSYPLTVVLDAPEGVKILPGMAANVHIDFETGGEALKGISLPVSSLFADANGQPCVWRIDPSAMTVNKTRVKDGAIAGEQVRIESGLEPGDLVVTAGTRFLLEGQEVRLSDESKGTRE
ncbi:MAG: efflux RND transporter periplasmic adaptor subunit [Desulfatibacillum sp.]|nr:efflux RND transporter periplasmic adaptor subunit [Desulfatibacillum sp.]